MKAKIVICLTLLAALLSQAPARAQEQDSSSYFTQSPETTPPPVPPPFVQEAPPPAPQPTALLSDWITHCRRNGCDEPTGRGGPFMTELFIRSGWSLPTGATQFGRTLNVGWDIQGGARGLLFNSAMDRAWTAEISMSNVNNHGQHSDIHWPLSVIGTSPLGTPEHLNFGTGKLPGVTVRGLNRTYVNLGIGREWYLWAPANAPGRHWRVGFDTGGRWGTARLDLFEFKHRTGPLGGVWTAFHSDLEIPWGACTFLAGGRVEWDYTWSHLLQTVTDVMSVNMLISLGVRY
jgi:hypothetical protein